MTSTLSLRIVPKYEPDKNEALEPTGANSADSGNLDTPAIAPLGNESHDKSRLIAAACHDMRQPLRALIFFSETLKESSCDTLQRRLAQQIGGSVEILSRMFDQMLTMLQLDAYAFRIRMENVSIGALLSRLANEFEPLASAKFLTLEIESCDVMVCSDQVLLYRVLSNLVSNAIRFTESGHVTIRCIEKPGMLNIQVSDTGVGIAAADLPHIFEEFYQVDHPSRARHDGLGLGLANVRRISALLGIQVDVESEPGTGSTFSLDIDIGLAEYACLPRAF